METLDIALPKLVNPMGYLQYRLLSEQLVAQEKTTGDEQSEQRIAFTKLNQQRMKRVEKQFVLNPELEVLLTENIVNWKWLVLMEAWCGDGAQLLPALAAIAAANSGITLTIVLRDENPELMDTSLSNGSRAIPKLICIDAETGERVFEWGPRPVAIQQKVIQLKAENPTIDHETLVLNLHTWYAKDRSQAVQNDMAKVLSKVFSKVN